METQVIEPKKRGRKPKTFCSNVTSDPALAIIPPSVVKNAQVVLFLKYTLTADQEEAIKQYSGSTQHI